MKPKDVQKGKVYEHDLDGIWWRVKVQRVYKDPQTKKWSWDGYVMETNKFGGSCWGLVSELRECAQ